MIGICARIACSSRSVGTYASSISSDPILSCIGTVMMLNRSARRAGSDAVESVTTATREDTNEKANEA